MPACLAWRGVEAHPSTPPPAADALALGARTRMFLPLRSWKLQLVGAGVGVVVAIVSAQSLASAREGATSYLVQPGDTLSAIATPRASRSTSWSA